MIKLVYCSLIKKHIAETGDVVFCKKGTWHKIITISDDPAVRLSIAIDNQETITE